LVLWSGLSTLVVLAVLGVALYLVVARNLETTGINQLTFRSQQFAHFQDPRSGPGQGFSFGGGASGTFALIANDQGQAVGPGSFFMPSEFPIEAGIDAARTSGVDIRTTVVDGTPVRVRTEKADSNVGTVYIQVIQDRTAEQQTLDAIVRVLFLGGAVVVVVAVAFGAVYARRALVPIRESLASQRAALRRQREFAADASHELRTPLTVIRSSVEHLRRSRGADGSATTTEALDDIDAEVGHLTALVEDLLLLARSDSGAITLNRLPVDLGDVAADGAGALAKLADERGVRLGLDPEPAMAKGYHARRRPLHGSAAGHRRPAGSGCPGRVGPGDGRVPLGPWTEGRTGSAPPRTATRRLSGQPQERWWKMRARASALRRTPSGATMQADPPPPADPIVPFSGRTPSRSSALRAGIVVGGALIVAVGAAVVMAASPGPSTSGAGAQPSAATSTPGNGSSNGNGFGHGGFGGFGPGKGGRPGFAFRRITGAAILGSNLSLTTEGGWTRTNAGTSGTPGQEGGPPASP